MPGRVIMTENGDCVKRFQPQLDQSLSNRAHLWFHLVILLSNIDQCFTVNFVVDIMQDFQFFTPSTSSWYCVQVHWRSSPDLPRALKAALSGNCSAWKRKALLQIGKQPKTKATCRLKRLGTETGWVDAGPDSESRSWTGVSASQARKSEAGKIRSGPACFGQL